MKHVVLICGGQSPEHEISLRSAKNILEALDRSSYQVDVIGISQTGRWRHLEENQLNTVVEGDLGREVHVVPGSNDCFIRSGQRLGAVDVVFPVLHGPNGEDGAIQGLLQLLGVPFVGPGVLGSSVSMDKDVAKQLLRQADVPVVDWLLIRKGDQLPKFDEVQAQLGSPVFVKPANMGSSVGVSKVAAMHEWEPAVKEALVLDDKVLVEQAIVGREIECAVKGNHHPIASGVGEIQAGHFYTYDEKYAATSSAQLHIPAAVTPLELDVLKKTAQRAYQALECKGLARVDMFLSQSGSVLVNEVNTMPGFTSISMYPALWQQAGITYTQLISELLELAMEPC